MKKFLWLTLFSIFAVPLSCVIPLQGTDVWYVQYLALFVIFFIGISFVLWKFNKYFSIFLMICLYSTIVTTQQSPRSLLMLIQLGLSFLSIYAISFFNKDQRKMILKAIIGIVIIQGIYIVVQYLNIDPIFNLSNNPLKDDTVGFSGSHNQIGVFLSTTSPLILSSFPIALPLSIFGLWCSTTSSAWVGFIVANCFLTWWLSKKFFLITLISITICSAIFIWKFESISPIAYQERFDLYRHTISQVESGRAVMEKDNIKKIITCNPWFGFGLGNFMRISPYTQTSFLVSNHPKYHRYAHAHNDYLEVFWEMGRLGFISLILIVGNFFYRFWWARKTKILLICFSCILAHMVSALGIFTVHTAVSGMLLVLFVGLFFGELREQGEVLNGQNSSVV